jgi:hypothetical protein
MAKRALLCGCNYPGSSHALNGCVNDVNAMHTMLTTHFGFSPEDITKLIDTDPSSVQPTGANIKVTSRSIVNARKHIHHATQHQRAGSIQQVQQLLVVTLLLSATADACMHTCQQLQCNMTAPAGYLVCFYVAQLPHQPPTAARARR